MAVLFTKLAALTRAVTQVIFKQLIILKVGCVKQRAVLQVLFLTFDFNYLFSIE